jgi:biotin synthase
MIERIKRSFDAAVTLCVGEREREEYRLWRHAGADRYLLKIETSDAPNLRCIRMSFGDQVGVWDLVN